MMNDNILNFISNHRVVGVVVTNNETFSSQLIMDKFRRIKTNIPIKFVELSTIKYYAQVIGLVAVPAIIIFVKGEIVDICRGVYPVDFLENFLEKYE